jgi:hypothetical protein
MFKLCRVNRVQCTQRHRRVGQGSGQGQTVEEHFQQSTSHRQLACYEHRPQSNVHALAEILYQC